MNKKLLIILVFLLATTPVHAAQTLTLMLDWFPNIDHLPIYVAQQEGIFAKAGLKVDILTPSDTTDALKLAAMHKVDIAVSYEPQAVAAASQKLPIVVVGRLVEHPLGVLLFLDGKGIYKPKDLEGLRIGYTVPGMEDILLKAFADKNDIKSYTPINVGFTIIPSLVSGKVDAIMGPYKNYEAVELKEKGYPASYFEPCKFGIPDYDELVFITGMQILKKNPSAIRAFVKAIEKAITITRQDPDKALATYFKAVPEANRSMESKGFDVTLPLYASTQTHDVARWQAFADFALASGLIQHPVKAAALIKNF